MLLFESEDENNIEQWNRSQDEISWGEECVDEKHYGHFKSEWKKIVLFFFLLRKVFGNLVGELHNSCTLSLLHSRYQ